METNKDDLARKPLLVVRIEGVKPFSKNTLKAFVDFEIGDIGLLVRGASVHQKGDARWLSLPAKEYERNGSRAWSPIVECPDKYAKQRLQDAVLGAYDAFTRNGGSE
jgi:hypothetical protein